MPDISLCSEASKCPAAVRCLRNPFFYGKERNAYQQSYIIGDSELGTRCSLFAEYRKPKPVSKEEYLLCKYSL